MYSFIRSVICCHFEWFCGKRLYPAYVRSGQRSDCTCYRIFFVVNYRSSLKKGTSKRHGCSFLDRSCNFWPKLLPLFCKLKRILGVDSHRPELLVYIELYRTILKFVANSFLFQVLIFRGEIWKIYMQVWRIQIFLLLVRRNHSIFTGMKQMLYLCCTSLHTNIKVKQRSQKLI